MELNMDHTLLTQKCKLECHVNTNLRALDSLVILSRFFRKKAYVLIGFFYILNFGFGQDQRISDSLFNIYENGKKNRSEKLELLRQLAIYETDYDKKLNFGLRLIIEAQKLDSSLHEFAGYFQTGNAYRSKGELAKALENYLEAATVAQTNQIEKEKAYINIPIADVYSIMENVPTAVSYYQKAIDLTKNNSDSINLAVAQLNLGDLYYYEDQLDSALFYFEESGKVFKALQDDLGDAYNNGNLGLVYAKLDDSEYAEEYLNNAIKALTEFEDYYPITVYLNAMSDIYADKGQRAKAMQYAQQSLELAKKYGLKEQIGDSNLKLSGYYEQRGDARRALQYYKDYISYRDSVSNIDKVQELANLRTEYEVSQKQAEVDLKQVEVDLLNQRTRTNRIVAIIIGIALLCDRSLGAVLISA